MPDSNFFPLPHADRVTTNRARSVRPRPPQAVDRLAPPALSLLASAFKRNRSGTQRDTERLVTMPTYEYLCEANGRIVEVRHKMSEQLSTWGELCNLAGIAVGHTAPSAPVQKLMSASFVGTGSSASASACEAPGCGSEGCGSGGCGGGMCAFD